MLYARMSIVIPVRISDLMTSKGEIQIYSVNNRNKNDSLGINNTSTGPISANVKIKSQNLYNICQNVLEILLF